MGALYNNKRLTEKRYFKVMRIRRGKSKSFFKSSLKIKKGTIVQGGKQCRASINGEQPSTGYIPTTHWSAK
jgi:hypothetical protein